MIFIKGEFVRILSGSWERIKNKEKKLLPGKVGQIYKIGDIDNSDYPYMVITVLNNETFKFMAKKEELEHVQYRQEEVAISKYLKKVKK